MDWQQFTILMLTVLGMFLWLKNDTIANRQEMAADRRDILQLIRAIQEEIKDFHGRLCSIEERTRK